MRECAQQAHITYEAKDKRLQASTHQPEDRRIQGCEYTSKQVNTNIRI